MNGVTNFIEKIPGSTVTAYLGRRDGTNKWACSLYTGEGDDDEFLCVQEHDFEDMTVTAGQVARITFLLSVEYGDR